MHLLKLELMALKLRTVTLYWKFLLRFAVRTKLLGLELVGESLHSKEQPWGGGHCPSRLLSGLPFLSTTLIMKIPKATQDQGVEEPEVPRGRRKHQSGKLTWKGAIGILFCSKSLMLATWVSKIKGIRTWSSLWTDRRVAERRSREGSTVCGN